MPTRTSLFALLDSERLQRPSSQLVGIPADILGGSGNVVQLPVPDVIVIVPESSDSPDTVFLYKLTASGEFCGDTWHESVAHAIQQAEFEFGDTLGEWQDVPAEAPDAQDFAVAAARSRAGGRQKDVH